MEDEKEIKKLDYFELLQATVRQYVPTLLLHQDAYRFIRQTRPWAGLHRYGWTVRVLLVGAVMLGFSFFSDLMEILKEATSNPQVFGANMMSFFSDFSFSNFETALSGGKKYLVLVILEIVTFHFVQHTLEKKIGRPPDHSFAAFLKAEKRMIRVAIVSWAMELTVRIIVNIPIGFLGLSFLEEPVGLLIQFYFVGFALVDNYHECFDLTIKESSKRTVRVTGVAVATGMVAYVLMFVPLVGVVAASMLGAVTVAMAMERFNPVTTEEVTVLAAARKKGEKQRKASNSQLIDDSKSAAPQ